MAPRCPDSWGPSRPLVGVCAPRGADVLPVFMDWPLLPDAWARGAGGAAEVRGCGLFCAEVGGYGWAWFLLGPWLSGAGAGPSQVHGWWACYQGHCLVWLLPGPLANRTDGRVWKGGPRAESTGHGAALGLQPGPPPGHAPTESPGLPPQLRPSGSATPPLFTSSTSCLGPKAPAKALCPGVATMSLFLWNGQAEALSLYHLASSQEMALMSG